MYSISQWINKPEHVDISHMIPPSGGYSIYRITFKDGAAYIGISEDVTERIKKHFEDGEGSNEVYERFSKGEYFRFEILATNLTEEQAKSDEKALIKGTDNALNKVFNPEQ